MTRVTFKRPNDRILLALDNMSSEKQLALIQQVGTDVGGIKRGLEAFLRELRELRLTVPMGIDLVHCVEQMLRTGATSTPEGMTELIGELKSIWKTHLHLQAARHITFIDLKFDDIAATVRLASSQVAYMQPLMFNVHCAVGPDALKAAKAAAMEVVAPEGTRLVIGVTYLTSLGYDDGVAIGIFQDEQFNNEEVAAVMKTRRVSDLVLKRAKLAQACGLDGVVCATENVAMIRRECGDDFILVVPGIRFADSATHDQKRTGTAYQAIKDGATYLVAGRTVTDAKEPPAAIQRMVAEIVTAEQEAA